MFEGSVQEALLVCASVRWLWSQEEPPGYARVRSKPSAILTCSTLTAGGCIDRVQFEVSSTRIGERTSPPNVLRASVVQTEVSSGVAFDAEVDGPTERKKAASWRASVSILAAMD